jgi:hypothetical protein
MSTEGKVAIYVAIAGTCVGTALFILFPTSRVVAFVLFVVALIALIFGLIELGGWKHRKRWNTKFRITGFDNKPVDGRWFFRGEIENSDKAIEHAVVELYDVRSAKDGKRPQNMTLQWRGGMRRPDTVNSGPPNKVFDIAVTKGTTVWFLGFVGDNNLDDTFPDDVYTFKLRLAAKDVFGVECTVKLEVTDKSDRQSIKLIEVRDRTN